jgi:hypothetical protein
VVGDVVVEDDELVDGVEVVLVEELVDVVRFGRSTFAAGAIGGRAGGSEVLGGEGATEGVVVVVVPVVDVVIKTSVVGPTRSGIRPSLPWIDPANIVTATTPTSASTTPLDAAMIVDRWCHHAPAERSYSGTSSVSKSHASGSSSPSSNPSNDAPAVGSGGGHIPRLFHLAQVPSGMAIRHSTEASTEVLTGFVAKLECWPAKNRLRRGIWPVVNG